MNAGSGQPGPSTATGCARPVSTAVLAAAARPVAPHGRAPYHRIPLGAGVGRGPTGVLPQRTSVVEERRLWRISAGLGRARGPPNFSSAMSAGGHGHPRSGGQLSLPRHRARSHATRSVEQGSRTTPSASGFRRQLGCYPAPRRRQGSSPGRSYSAWHTPHRP